MFKIGDKITRRKKKKKNHIYFSSSKCKYKWVHKILRYRFKYHKNLIFKYETVSGRNKALFKKKNLRNLETFRLKYSTDINSDML